MLTQREKVARHGPGTDRTDTDPLRRMPVDKMVVLMEARAQVARSTIDELDKQLLKAILRAPLEGEPGFDQEAAKKQCELHMHNKTLQQTNESQEQHIKQLELQVGKLEAKLAAKAAYIERFFGRYIEGPPSGAIQVHDRRNETELELKYHNASEVRMCVSDSTYTVFVALKGEQIEAVIRYLIRALHSKTPVEETP